MITIRENTHQRLALTDAQHAGLGAILLLLLFGELIALGVMPRLGGFGMIFAALWTAGFAFFINQYKWTNAVFDANAQTLRTTMRWIYGRQHTTTQNLSDLDHVIWEEITLWAELTSSKDKAESVRRNLIVRKIPEREFAPTQLERDYRENPLVKTAEPVKWPEDQVDAVIDSWLKACASKGDP